MKNRDPTLRKNIPSTTVSDSQRNFPEFQHAFDVARCRHDEVRGEDLLDHRPHDRLRGAARQPTSSFVLEPGIRQGREHDVALPSRVGSSFEVIEPEFLFELLILLLDRPALMRGAD